jgi:hypothetical protein
MRMHQSKVAEHRWANASRAVSAGSNVSRPNRMRLRRFARGFEPGLRLLVIFQEKRGTG